MHPYLSLFLSRLLVDRCGGYRQEVLRQFRALRCYDAVSCDAIVREHSTQLAAMLNHAREHSAFYCDRIPEHITADNARDALRIIPVLAKKDIQERARDIVVPGMDSIRDATGGSSGEPMVFYTDLERKKAGEAATYWSNSLAGFEYGDRVAMLWGAARDSGEGRMPEDGCRMSGVWKQLRVGMRNWVENVRWYDAFDMGENRMHDFHKQMTRFAPHVLVGYAGSLYEYVRFLEANNIKPGYLLKSIISSAEVLTSATRKMVSDVFQKPIFDRYGNREFGPIAAECEAHDGLHINEHDMYVEIDSPNPYEIPGEILVTYFRNKAMPFVRYNTGDVGLFARGECACGRKTRRLKTIDGRTSDSIRTREGNIIHGEYFTHMMYGVEWVRAFQFVQETLDRYVLRVECDPQIAQINTNLWVQEIRDKLGENVAVRVECVDKIPLLLSGKRKFTVSMIK